METNVKIKFTVGNQSFHPLANESWAFPVSISEDDTEKMELEAHLADAVIRYGETNGMTINELQHIFPAILRMLKETNSPWSK